MTKKNLTKKAAESAPAPKPIAAYLFAGNRSEATAWAAKMGIAEDGLMVRYIDCPSVLDDAANGTPHYRIGSWKSRGDARRVLHALAVLGSSWEMPPSEPVKLV